MKSLSIKQVAVVLAVLLGLILAFSPVSNKSIQEIDSNILANEIIDRKDHITAEQLGHLIIDEDPDYQIIDLREPAEYEKFHIKTAINLPMQNLFTDNNLDYIDPEKLVVLYSNGGTHAAQAWVLLQAQGITNTTILLGGLNYWVDVYSNPTPPQGVYADSEVFNYQFKVSAGDYLMGNVKAQGNKTENAAVPEIKIPRRKKKAKKGDEGC
jgi:rhodanese-related sulfurtransferase